jgi:hypothetical protein
MSIIVDCNRERSNVVSDVQSLQTRVTQCNLPGQGDVMQDVMEK